MRRISRVSALWPRAMVVSILTRRNATMMPSCSGAVRAEQLTVLAELAHEVLTQPALGELLAEAEAQVMSLSDWQHATGEKLNSSYYKQHLRTRYLSN